MKKPNCCKKIANKTFKDEGKVLAVSLFLVWFFIAVFTGELNPSQWPTLMKPLFLIVTCPVFGYLSNNGIQVNRLNRKKVNK
jgi:hypothetical protein